MSQRAENPENSGDTIFALYGEKIEMDNGVYMGCRSSERHETRDTRQSMMTTLDTHTYWTAMAHEVSLAAPKQEHEQEDEDEHEHYKHKFGLCNECGYGLDDESDFVLHPMTGGDTLILCVECWIHPCPWGCK
jgi:hypothetical protein